MANYRATMLLQQSVAGWGESFFTNQASANAALDALQALVQKRVACIGPQAQVRAIRAQNVDGQGDARVRILDQPGTSSAVDTPYQSLIVHFRDEDGRRLVHLMRGIPDAQVEQGLFKPSPAYTTRLRDYLQAVVDGPFVTRRLDRTNPLKKISSITEGGLLECLQGHGLVVGDRIKIMRTRSTVGQTVTGEFFVASAPSTFTAQLSGWGGQAVLNNGSFRKIAYVFKNINAFEYGQKVTSRKVGRPFDSPRGRQSTRR